MIRWLVIGLLVFGFSTGVRRGWLQVRWSLMLQELGLPLLPQPSAQSDCVSPAAPRSSARQAR